MKILNLYAGIGGNRKHWGDRDITMVEKNEKIAQIYSDHFPHDEVIIADAHQYLLNHYKEYDFIWSSPPCPTHSRTNIMSVLSDNPQAGTDHRKAKYPDMKLYQEIILLDSFADSKWVVENVMSYYQPLIEPQRRHRHYFWSNFYIPAVDIEPVDYQHGTISKWEEIFGFDLSNYEGINKRKVLRNCVHPELGKTVFEAGLKKKPFTRKPLFSKG